MRRAVAPARTSGSDVQRVPTMSTTCSTHRTTRATTTTTTTTTATATATATATRAITTTTTTATATPGSLPRRSVFSGATSRPSAPPTTTARGLPLRTAATGEVSGGSPAALTKVNSVVRPAPALFDIGSGVELPVTSDVAPLFAPYNLSNGRFQLSNRIVYAPLTRMRAVGTIPQSSAAVYYSQRAVPGGLMISEAANIAPEGLGYMNVPGLWLREQLEAWRPIVRAVHDKGGLFFCQLWHCGRASHPDLQPGGAAPISSSTRPITSPEYQVYTPSGPKPYTAPRAATRDDIKRLVGEFVRAAKNAIEVAGFDGVEIHGANGYLMDQFIRDSINDRTDEYGGSIENRCRFALEVVEAVSEAVGSDRVGIRFSPFNTYLDAYDSTPYSTFTYLAEKLNSYGLSYIHMVEPRMFGNTEKDYTPDSLEPFRRVYRGTLITNGGFKPNSGAAAIASGHADLVAYGRWYLANPDFHKRILLSAPLNQYDRDTYYSAGLEGYIDYPTLDQLEGQ